MKLTPDMALGHAVHAGMDGTRSSEVVSRRFAALSHAAHAGMDGADNFLALLRDRGSSPPPSTPAAPAAAGPAGRSDLAAAPMPAVAATRVSAGHQATDRVDWPWLAIATGGLSYRPVLNAPASMEVWRTQASVTSQAVAVVTPVPFAAVTIDPTRGAGSSQTPFATIASLRATPPVGSLTAEASDTREVNAAAWLLPAELREQLERRRLRLIEDGHGGLRLFARDFALSEAESAHWAASLRDAYQSMNQTLRALWINGRAYDVLPRAYDIPPGESHDR